MLRGLSTRSKFALSIVLRKAEHPEADDLFHEALMDAEALGVYDYDDGLRKPPNLFMDIRELKSAWMYGYNFAVECAEMDSCPNCNDHSGNPCPSHG